MMNVIIENMAPIQRKKNLLQDEEEGNPSETPKKVSLTIEGYLTQMGIEWEQKGRAIYIYPSSIQVIKEILEKMPNPAENQYVIIPLGQTSGYNVFIMVTKSSITVRIGYGRNSIPFSSSLMQIMEKVEKVTKEIGIESRKNGRNLLGV